MAGPFPYVVPMVTALRSMVVAGLATVLGVVIGVVVLGGGDGDGAPGGPGDAGGQQPIAPPEVLSTPLADFDTRNLAIGRDSFCDGVDDEAVSEVLGADLDKASSYDNGQRAPVTSEVRDVAHEFGCSWTADGTTARGWVFTPPVPRGQARKLIKAASSGIGCRPAADARFGKPSVALICDAQGESEASYRGLFGDAWLTCTLVVPAATDSTELVDRTGRWCVAVAAAAAELAP